MSPVLTGRFLSTAPLGKSLRHSHVMVLGQTELCRPEAGSQGALVRDLVFVSCLRSVDSH